MDGSDFLDDLRFDEDVSGASLLPKGTAVRVTVAAEASAPFHYLPGSLGVLAPGETFLAIVEEVVSAHDAVTTTPAGAAGASGSNAARRVASAAVTTTRVPESYRVVALGAESKLRAGGEALNQRSLAMLALSAFKTLVVPCAWVVEAAETHNLAARLQGAKERVAAVAQLSHRARAPRGANCSRT